MMAAVVEVEGLFEIDDIEVLMTVRRPNNVAFKRYD